MLGKPAQQASLDNVGAARAQGPRRLGAVRAAEVLRRGQAQARRLRLPRGHPRLLPGARGRLPPQAAGRARTPPANWKAFIAETANEMRDARGEAGRQEVTDGHGRSRAPRRPARATTARPTVIHGIDLDIRHGEFVVFVGPSGLRQEHAAAHDRRAGDHLRRRDPHRRPASSTTCRRATATSRWCSRTTRCTRT